VLRGCRIHRPSFAPPPSPLRLGATAAPAEAVLLPLLPLPVLPPVAREPTGGASPERIPSDGSFFLVSCPSSLFSSRAFSLSSSFGFLSSRVGTSAASSVVGVVVMVMVSLVSPTRKGEEQIGRLWDTLSSRALAFLPSSPPMTVVVVVGMAGASEENNRGESEGERPWSSLPAQLWR